MIGITQVKINFVENKGLKEIITSRKLLILRSNA